MKKQEDRFVHINDWKFNLFDIYRIEDTKITVKAKDGSSRQVAGKKITLHNGTEIELHKKESQMLLRVMQTLGLPNFYI